MLRFSIVKAEEQNVPPRERKPRFLAWLKVFISYLGKIKDALEVFWEETIEDVMMTPQIIYLEHLLNTRYERNPWDIFIGDGFDLGPWFFTDNLPGDPEFYWDQDDSYLWTNNDVVNNVDFVVNVPDAVESAIPVIAGLVQKYKLAGKIFVIQIYI
jgi:hypothetical protein